MLEAAIEYQVLAYRIRHRPQISHRVAAQERLSKVPELAGDDEFLERMRYRDGLSILRAANTVLTLLVEEPIDIEVEAGHVITEHQQE